MQQPPRNPVARCAVVAESLRARLDHPDHNRGIASWGEIFEDTTVAAAILDRLLHHATVLHTVGTQV